jgi:catechol 2,3-dioxygenase-like lactoylglutathione lyase family enzyme
MGEVRWMMHATAMGPDYDAILAPLARLFGCRVMHRWQGDEPVGRDGGMTWIGDNSIEIGSPYGEGSSVAKFVARFGGGIHSVGLQVDDLAATLHRLELLGVEVAAHIGPDIVFTRPGATAGLLFEWGSHVQEDDPRFGAPELPFLQVPVVPVDRMAFVAALVRDPAVDARRLAELLDTGLVEFGDPGDPGALGPDVAHTALDLGDCMLALYPVPPNAEVSRSIWGGHYDRPRCIALALSVADQSAAEHALAAEHIPLHHRSPHGDAVLVDGLPFPVILTDRLLPGDPRRKDAP